jgi:hypothetical protein
MKKIITHIIAAFIGLAIGFSLSIIYFEKNYMNAVVDKGTTICQEVSVVGRIGDINMLIKEGYPKAAKKLDAGVYLYLGNIGNYFKKRKEIPSKFDWLCIDQALDYLQKADLHYVMYNEATEGITYLKKMKNMSSSDKSAIK